MRIAILSVEYPTKNVGFGGLATNFFQICQTLRRLRHQPEVFLHNNEKTPENQIHEGILIHNIYSKSSNLDKLIYKTSKLIGISEDIGVHVLSISRSIGRALERVESVQGRFDFVLSTSLCALPLFIRKRNDRPLVTFVTKSDELNDEADQREISLGRRWHYALLRYAMSRSNKRYANSAFLSEYYKLSHHLNTDVVRTPVIFDPVVSTGMFNRLPSRFLIHYGQLGRLKGSDLIARALPLAWQREPELTMVWAGVERDVGCMTDYCKLWKNHENQILYLGPVERSAILGVLSRAVASVFPSRADNLPNTVIESLLLSVPVIGTAGASIDELVEHRRNGWLVPPEDVEGLADAMVRFWRGDELSQPFEAPSVFAEMEPNRSAQNLIDYALK